MIKKIINVLSVMLILTTAILWYQSSKIYIPQVLQVYSIRTNYVIYDDEDNFNITLYLNDSSNILKKADENNIKLSSSKGSQGLILEKVEVGKRQGFNDERYFPYHLTISNFKDSRTQTFANCSLEIQNVKYTLKVNIGTIEYKVKEKNDLNIDYTKYYGVYNQVNNVSTLVGVVVSLSNKTNEALEINAISGGVLKIDSQKITKVNNVGNEDSVYNIVDDYQLKLANNSSRGYVLEKMNNVTELFIPISYSATMYATNIALEFTTGFRTYYMPNLTLKSSVATLSQMGVYRIKADIRW